MKIKSSGINAGAAAEDKCQRCGEEGEDRRTLHMACLYAMDELGLPFGQYRIDGEHCQWVGEKKRTVPFSSLPWVTPVFAKPTGKKSAKGQHQYFTLRVCKSCRASWMDAIRVWFDDKPGKVESCGSGIFVRRNGSNVEITDEEWFGLNPGREPVRFRR